MGSFVSVCCVCCVCSGGGDVYVCVCVCVRASERERECVWYIPCAARDRGAQSHPPKATHAVLSNVLEHVGLELELQRDVRILGIQRLGRHVLQHRARAGVEGRGEGGADVVDVLQSGVLWGTLIGEIQPAQSVTAAPKLFAQRTASYCTLWVVVGQHAELILVLSVHQVGVDVVGQHDGFVLFEHHREILNFLLGVDDARWIVWVVEQNQVVVHAGAGPVLRQRPVHLLGRNFAPVLRVRGAPVGVHSHGLVLAADDVGLLHVAGPRGQHMENSCVLFVQFYEAQLHQV